ncbi:unnamed protein product [Cladocopium goreaui]|uniref:EF-hand domain-containing protein n=1 Tax=Cladocopium goreaui TaxID=2562237 RepID=A0A9P1FNW3_9DINO|nr:unnamed protein product [Cladocopium goreaui]
MTSGAGEEPSWRQSEGEVLFEMLDKDKDGFLNQKEARTWLRSLGWCLVDEALDTLLKEAQTEAPRKKDISSPDHKKWVLPELINAVDLGQDLCGPHPEALQSAFRALGAQSTCSKDCFKQLATGVVSTTTHQERLEACTVHVENSSNQVLMNVFDDL